MFKKRFKPTLKNLDLSRTIPQDIIYYCKTSVLDEILCKKLKREFNQVEADGREEFVRFYFIVKSNSEYDVLPGPGFEKYLEENKIGKLSETPKSKACVDHYIQKMYSQFN